MRGCHHNIDTSLPSVSETGQTECFEKTLPGINYCKNHASKEDLLKCISYQDKEINKVKRHLAHIRRIINSIPEGIC